MRLAKGSRLLVATVLVLGAAGSLAHVILRGLGSDLGGFFSAIRILEREMEASDRLEDALRRTFENSKNKHNVLRDLIGQRCGLREAVLRYRSHCRTGDLLSFRAAYGWQGGSEEEVVAQHLLILVSRQLRNVPDVRAEMLRLLHKEATAIYSENALGPVAPLLRVGA